MKKQLHKLSGAIAILSLCLVSLIACKSSLEIDDNRFNTAPVLTVTAANKVLTCEWTPSKPAADSYDIYYVEGSVSGANSIKAGTKIENAGNPDKITGLKNGTVYSVLVTAKKSGYESIDSIIVQSMPNLVLQAPVLTLGNIQNGLVCEWEASLPAAETYDIYYKPGTYTDAANVKNGGVKLANKRSPYTITGLIDGSGYSVVVTANKTGYRSADSSVQSARINTPLLEAPVLSLIPGFETLMCTWSTPDPAGDSYDIYYREGTYTAAADVKAGIKITDAPNGRIISGLSNGVTYSVILTANKSGYQSADSSVKTGKPSVQKKNVKRGVSYNFTDNTNTPKQDMDLLGSGISWFYNWGQTISGAVASEAKNHNLEFMPMAWSGFGNELRNYISSNPEVEYVLGFNEPNLTDQANMTPPAAVSKWIDLRNLVRQNNRKLVSPAMNYGTLANYGDPIKWLAEFFGLRSVTQGVTTDYPGFAGVSVDDISAISIHCYMAYPGALKSYIGRYRTELKDKTTGAAIDKPVWMTEFCAWDDYPNRNSNPNGNHQMYYMSQVVTYMELDPAVEKYSWFIPKGPTTDMPFNGLLTRSNPPELSDLGLVYVNMSTCDKSVYAAAGETIAASRFTDCNISDDIGKWNTWNDSVSFRPTTDSEGASVLDIWNFTNGMWVEYQVDLTQAKSYTLTLRNKPDINANMTISLDGTQIASTTLNSSPVWKNDEVNLGTLSAGKHTVRLRVTGGICALNWLKAE